MPEDREYFAKKFAHTDADRGSAIAQMRQGVSPSELLIEIYDREVQRNLERDAVSYTIGVLEEACNVDQRPLNKKQWQEELQSHRILSGEFDQTFEAASRVPNLKVLWLKDPTWDVEDTPGMSYHKDELTRWRQSYEEKHGPLKSIALKDREFVKEELEAGTPIPTVLSALYERDTARRIERNSLTYTVAVVEHSARYLNLWTEQPGLEGAPAQIEQWTQKAIVSPTSLPQLASSLQQIAVMPESPQKYQTLFAAVNSYSESLRQEPWSRERMLGQALGEVLVWSGAVRKDTPFSGPELLTAAAELLQTPRPGQASQVASPSNDLEKPDSQSSHEEQLGQALGGVLVWSGVVREDAPLTGPELLLAAHELVQTPRPQALPKGIGDAATDTMLRQQAHQSFFTPHAKQSAAHLRTAYHNEGYEVVDPDRNCGIYKGPIVLDVSESAGTVVQLIASDRVAFHAVQDFTAPLPAGVQTSGNDHVVKYVNQKASIKEARLSTNDRDR